MKKIFLILFLAQVSYAENIMKDFDSLGGNDVLLDRAKALNPEVKTQVVQNRIVDLNNRFEVAPVFSNVFGGDAYVDTWMVGLSPQFHITPRWAIGLKYDYAFNELTSEGKRLIDNPVPIYDSNGQVVGHLPNVPAMDYIKQQGLMTVNWSPVYGKLNLHDLGVLHFDLYTTIGGGGIELESGWTGTYTAGAGLGFWISKHLSSHLEFRWQGYEAQRIPGKKEKMDLTIGSFQVGYLL